MLWDGERDVHVPLIRRGSYHEGHCYLFACSLVLMWDGEGEAWEVCLCLQERSGDWWSDVLYFVTDLNLLVCKLNERGMSCNSTSVI